MSDNLRSRKVHEVPVVGIVGIFEIHLHNGIPSFDGCFVIRFLFCRQFLETLDEQKEAAQTNLVIAIGQQFGNLLERHVLGVFHDLARLGHFQSQELVALAIFALARLEESHQANALLLVA